MSVEETAADYERKSAFRRSASAAWDSKPVLALRAAFYNGSLLPHEQDAWEQRHHLRRLFATDWSIGTGLTTAAVGGWAIVHYGFSNAAATNDLLTKTMLYAGGSVASVYGVVGVSTTFMRAGLRVKYKMHVPSLYGFFGARALWKGRKQLAAMAEEHDRLRWLNTPVQEAPFVAAASMRPYWHRLYDKGKHALEFLITDDDTQNPA